MPPDRLPSWLLPEVRLASRPALLSLVMLLLVGLGVVLACWGVRAEPEYTDFDLRAGHSSPKLDITSADSPDGPLAAAFPSEVDDVKEQTAAPLPDAPTVLEVPAPDPADSRGAYKIPDLPGAPVADAPGSPQLEPAETTPAPIFDDAGNLFIRSLGGDTPMIRTWKMLGYPAILAAAFSTAPQLAPADDKPNSDSKAEPTLRELKDSIEGIRRTLNSNVLNCNVVAEDLKKLRDQVAQLQKDVESLRTRSSTSNYQPTIAPNTANTGIASSAGRVRLINNWPERITVFLNNRSYSVEPDQQLMAEGMPAGDFTYEIMAVRPDGLILPIKPKQTRTLAGSETYVIHVHPQ
jgi:hypothetical protein